MNEIEDCDVINIKRRPRLAFAEEEVQYLLDGVEKYKDSPQRWRKILNNYAFNPRRTSVDLKDKWRNIVRVDPDKKETVSNLYGHKKVAWTEMEIEILRIGHMEMGDQKNPWANILQKYKDHFDPVRTSVHLKDKWRNLSCAAKRERSSHQLSQTTNIVRPKHTAAKRSTTVKGEPMNIEELCNQYDEFRRLGASTSSSVSAANPSLSSKNRSHIKSEHDPATGILLRNKNLSNNFDNSAHKVEYHHVGERIMEMDEHGNCHHYNTDNVELDDHGNPTEYIEEIVEYVEEGEALGEEDYGDTDHEIEEHVVDEVQPDGQVVRTITRERVCKRRFLGEEQEEREILSKTVETTSPPSNEKDANVIVQGGIWIGGVNGERRVRQRDSLDSQDGPVKKRLQKM